MAYGEFKGRDGRMYIVRFKGDGVPTNQLELSSVVISMDAGDRKFVGFKTTSCKIGIVTDTPLSWAYTESSAGVSVEVSDYYDGSIFFTGYIVPFAFEQPVSRCADNVTIDCVDVITANKEILYTSLEDGDRHGVDVRGIDIIRNMVNAAGGRDKISQIVIHKNFDWNNSDEIVLDTMVAQAGFIQDGMTALEAMNAVCVFFGFTAHLVGDKLWLYDEYAIINAANGYDLNAVVEGWETDEAGKYVRTKFYKDAASPLQLITLNNEAIHDDVTLTIERAYDGVQITPEGSDVSVICPDVCDDEYITKNTDGRGTNSTTLISYSGTAIDFTETRKPVESTLLILGESDGTGIKEWSSLAQLSGGWDNGAMMIARQKKTYKTAARGFEYIISEDPKNVLWIRDVQGNGLHRMGYLRKGYSHTGGYIELKVDWHWADDDTNSLEPIGNYGDSLENKLLHLKVGQRYFLSDNVLGLRYGDNYKFRHSLNSSEEQKYVDGVIFMEDGTVIPTNVASEYDRSSFLIKVDTDEQITLEIGVDRVVLSGDPIFKETGLVITSLEILGYGDEIYTGGYYYRRSFVSYPKEILDVETWLTSRHSYQESNPLNAPRNKPLEVNARPSVVPGTWYSGGGYLGSINKTAIHGSGVLMEQLSNRYNKPHNRYTMTLEGNISPTSKISYNGSYYTVEGYERDLVNNTTRITIN